MSYLRQRFSLFKQPSVLLHVVSCFLATTGAGMSFICMGWLVVSAYEEVSAMAWLLSCFWLPQIIFAPLVGAVVDRYSRRKVIILSNLVRVFALLIIAAIYSYQESIASIYILALCIGFVFAFYGPAALAFVRDIVQPGDLLYANSTVDMAYEVGFLVGITSGGIILSYLTPVWTFVINAICFLAASALTYAIVATEAHLQQVKKIDHLWQRFCTDTMDGLRYLRRNRHLFFLYNVQMAMYSVLLTSPILLTPFAKLVLNTSALGLSYIEGAYSIGVILGSFVVPYWVNKWGMRKVMIVGCLVMSATLFVFALNSLLWLACLLYLLLGVVLSTWAVITTAVQQATDPVFQGRLQTTFNAMASAIILGVYFFTGLISEFVTVRATYGVLILLALCTLYFVWRAPFAQAEKTDIISNK